MRIRKGEEKRGILLRYVIFDPNQDVLIKELNFSDTALWRKAGNLLNHHSLSYMCSSRTGKGRCATL
jgi:hypothetical protein